MARNERNRTLKYIVTATADLSDRVRLVSDAVTVHKMWNEPPSGLQKLMNNSFSWNN